MGEATCRVAQVSAENMDTVPNEYWIGGENSVVISNKGY